MGHRDDLELLPEPEEPRMLTTIDPDAPGYPGEAYGISDEEAAKLALEGAIKSALADGEVSDDEREMIEKAADTAGLSKAKKTKLAKALDSGEIGTDAKKILESL